MPAQGGADGGCILESPRFGLGLRIGILTPRGVFCSLATIFPVPPVAGISFSG